jgi:hypothetical protein
MAYTREHAVPSKDSAEPSPGEAREQTERIVRIPHDREQDFHGIVNTKSTASRTRFHGIVNTLAECGEKFCSGSGSA